MKKLLLVSFLALAVAAGAFADVQNHPRTALQEAVVPHSTGGATGFCSIVYYDLCSGWLWTYSGWALGDEPGVAFDLPNDCGKLPGEECTNTGFWWYWRYTIPTYGFTVSYDLYELDVNFCKAGPSLGNISGYDPVERWNFHYGLGAVTSDWAALIASYDSGSLPRFCTDNNNANFAAPLACPGYAIGPIQTYYWGGPTTQYCPPQYFADGYGAVDCLMDAGWDCQPSGTSTEDASWSGVKSLFR